MARPTARVLALLELLQVGGVQPVRQLAAQLGVDERTVRRYVEHLIELEIPVESVRGRYGGYRIGPGHRLPPLMLTEGEAVVAVYGLSMAVRIGIEEEVSAAGTAAAKIRRVLPAAVGRRVDALLASAPSAANESGRATTTSSVLLTTAQAAHDGRPVRLEYVDRNGRSSSRSMLPWGLVAHRGRWYVTGPDLTSGEHRTFRLDRVARVEVERGRFEVPEDFDSRKQVLAGIMRTPWQHDVSVLVQANTAQVRAQLPEEIALVEPVPSEGHPSGADQPWVRVRLRAERLDWVAAAIASIDAPFVVERPDVLRESLLAFARRVTAGAHAVPFTDSASGG